MEIKYDEMCYSCGFDAAGRLVLARSSRTPNAQDWKIFSNFVCRNKSVDRPGTERCIVPPGFQYYLLTRVWGIQ